MTSPPFRRRALDERGYTMFFAIIVMFVSSLLVAGAFAAAEGDIHLAGTNTAQQKAYDAALAGVQDYKYQMMANPNYWLTCPQPSGKVPGAEGNIEEKYSVTTLSANGHPTCESLKQATIIETSGTASGTFRIESTGSYKNGASSSVTRKIVATFTHPGFLNYVFLSNYEVEDPQTLSPEPTRCAQYLHEREKAGATGECPPIQFIGGDKINGPFHTNDGVAVCGHGAEERPSFGGLPNDAIEMGQGHYAAEGCKNELNLVGKYSENAGTLLPPLTDTELLETAEANYKFKGRTVIELKPESPKNKIKVTTWNFTLKTPETSEKTFPVNGIIYVSNEGSCAYKYSPFSKNEDYEKDEADHKCGNIYIKGNYTEGLTVAAQNDVIVIGNILTTPYSAGAKSVAPTGAATLGLIAEDFVRVYHPVTGGLDEPNKCTSTSQSEAEDPRKWGSLKELTVDAAILATNHSWIVDNYRCAINLGSLNVWGAIGQFWRGPVGAGGSPYLKNYNYDARLASKQPPNFLSPSSTNWHITRATAP